MTRTTVHLLRHGEVFNPDGILYGRIPGFRLSDDGLRMAHDAAQAVRDRDVTEVVASPLQRAQETAGPIAAVFGQEVRAVSRLGKRIVFTFATATRKDEPLHLVIHLMIAGRFRWKPPGAGVPGKIGLAAFDFAAASTTSKAGKSAAEKEAGTLLLTEALPAGERTTWRSPAGCCTASRTCATATSGTRPSASATSCRSGRCGAMSRADACGTDPTAGSAGSPL